MQIINHDAEIISKVKEGLTLSPLISKRDNNYSQGKCQTAYSNGRQCTVYSREQILKECIKSNFIDCRINAYPVSDESYLQAPNIIFIGLDLSRDLTIEEDIKRLEKTKSKSVITIKEKWL